MIKASLRKTLSANVNYYIPVDAVAIRLFFLKTFRAAFCTRQVYNQGRIMFNCCACIGLAQDVEQAYRFVTSMYSRKAFLYNAHNKIVAVTFQ